MDDFFKPTDFASNPSFALSAESATEFANNKLKAYVESLPMIYGQILTGKRDYQWDAWQFPENTHKARLWGMEPIDNTGCKHVPYTTHLDEYGMPSEVKCRKCGKRLVASWKDVNE